MKIRLLVLSKGDERNHKHALDWFKLSMRLAKNMHRPVLPRPFLLRPADTTQPTATITIKRSKNKDQSTGIASKSMEN